MKLRTLLPWVLFGLVIFGTNVIAAEEFEYNKRNRRDPFVPLVTKTGDIRVEQRGVETLADVKLEGILWDPKGESLVMINGMVLKRGEPVGPYVVYNIDQDAVRLRRGTDEYRIPVKEEE